MSKGKKSKQDQKRKTAKRAQTFRAGVGALILNESGKVLGLERKDIPGAWQLPQGGMEAEETPLEAVRREVREETGVPSNALELLTDDPRLLVYELPPELRSKKTGRGQAQYWFLFRFTGPETAITLGDQKEFSAWKWMPIDQLAEYVIWFKQPMYRELADHFRPYLKADAG